MDIFLRCLGYTSERLAEIFMALSLDIQESLHVTIIYAALRCMLKCMLPNLNSITKVLNIDVYTHISKSSYGIII